MNSPADLIDRYTNHGEQFRHLLNLNSTDEVTVTLLTQMTRTAYSLDLTESELIRAAGKLEAIAKRIRSNVNPSGEPHYDLDPNGEMAGTVAQKVDALIATRAQQILTLQALAEVIAAF